MPDPVAEALRTLRAAVDAARARGHVMLGEPELLPVFSALGWRTPAMRLLEPDDRFFRSPGRRSLHS